MARLNLTVWSHLPTTWRRWRIVDAVVAGDEVPEHLPRKAAVLVGTSEQPSWVAFDCPCDEAHRVMLNLNRTRRPRWSVTGSRPLTIAPSIDEVRGVKRCHYFIRSGRIRWVPYNDDRNY